MTHTCPQHLLRTSCIAQDAFLKSRVCHSCCQAYCTVMGWNDTCHMSMRHKPVALPDSIALRTLLKNGIRQKGL